MPPQNKGYGFLLFHFISFCLTLVCLFVLKLTVGFKAIKSCMHWFKVLMK